MAKTIRVPILVPIQNVKSLPNRPDKGKHFTAFLFLVHLMSSPIASEQGEFVCKKYVSVVRGEISEVGSNAESDIIDKLPLLALPHSPHRHPHHCPHHQRHQRHHYHDLYWPRWPSWVIVIIILEKCGSPTGDCHLTGVIGEGGRKAGPIVIKNLFFIQFCIRQKNNDLTLVRPAGFDIPSTSSSVSW